MMQSLPLHHRPALHEEAEAGATERQNTKEEYQKLGFQTSHGLEWFTLSPETLVQCLIESEFYMLRSAPTDNIDFEAVLSTNTFVIDLEQQTPGDFDSKSLLEAVDTAVEEGVRQRSMIRRVIKDMLEQRHGVSKSDLEKAEALLDNQIRELGIVVPEKWNPKSLSIKVRLVLSNDVPLTDEYRHVLLQNIYFCHSSSKSPEYKARNFILLFKELLERTVITFRRRISICPTICRSTISLPRLETRP